jgi:hypothetical protein
MNSCLKQLLDLTMQFNEPARNKDTLHFHCDAYCSRVSIDPGTRRHCLSCQTRHQSTAMTCLLLRRQLSLQNKITLQELQS